MKKIIRAFIFISIVTLSCSGIALGDSQEEKINALEAGICSTAA